MIWGRVMGTPWACPTHHVWAPRRWLPELATSEEEAPERARTSHRAFLGGQGQSQAKLLLFRLGLFRELNRAPMPLAPGNWEAKMPNNVTLSPPGPLNPQAVPRTSSAQLYLSHPQSAGRMKASMGTAPISAQQALPWGSLTLDYVLTVALYRHWLTDCLVPNLHPAPCSFHNLMRIILQLHPSFLICNMGTAVPILQGFVLKSSIFSRSAPEGRTAPGFTHIVQDLAPRRCSQTE